MNRKQNGKSDWVPASIFKGPRLKTINIHTSHKDGDLGTEPAVTAEKEIRRLGWTAEWVKTAAQCRVANSTPGFVMNGTESQISSIRISFYKQVFFMLRRETQWGLVILCMEKTGRVFPPFIIKPEPIKSAGSIDSESSNSSDYLHISVSWIKVTVNRTDGLKINQANIWIPVTNIKNNNLQEGILKERLEFSRIEHLYKGTFIVEQDAFIASFYALSVLSIEYLALDSLLFTLFSNCNSSPTVLFRGCYNTISLHYFISCDPSWVLERKADHKQSN